MIRIDREKYSIQTPHDFSLLKFISGGEIAAEFIDVENIWLQTLWFDGATVRNQ